MKEISYTHLAGTVRLLNNSGNDNTIVNAATISNSYDTVVLPEKKQARLMESMPQEGHWGTFDHNHVTVKIECPIFVARQLFRSSGMKFNEMSGRYAEMLALGYIPEVWYTDVLRKDLGNEPVPITEELQEVIHKAELQRLQDGWNHYQWKLSMGIRKEQARISLPVQMYTAFWMTGSLRSWLHFLNLRTDTHSQAETVYVANEIWNILDTLYPKAVEYWEKYGKGPINNFGTIQTA